MSISGNKSYSNSNTSGSNQFKQLTDQIDVNTTNIAINTADILINSNNIATNTTALTGISYIPTPTPTTSIINNLNISGTSNLSNTNITGEIYLIDDVDTSKQMKIHWVPANNGYFFESLNNGAFIYFVVKDPYGGIRAFQFNYNQVYSSIPFFCNANFTMDGGIFIQGTNSTHMQFVASPNPWDGWVHMVKQNNFYINWYCRNSVGSDINVFRLHNTKISSLIDHEFIGNILVASTTISPTELSYLDNVTSNIQTQLNGKLSSTADITILSSRAAMNLISNTNFRGISVLSAATAGQFNPLVLLDNCVVSTRFKNLSTLILTVSSDLNMGIKIDTTSGSAGSIVSNVGSNNININNSNITLNSSNVIVSGSLNINTNLVASSGNTTLYSLTVSYVTYLYDWTYFFKDIIFAHSSTKLVLTTPSVTLTQTELSYLSGVTSNIQTQLDNKLSLLGGTLSGNLTINDIIFANSTSNIVLNTPSLNISQTELSYLDNVTSNIQTQLNNKLSLSGGTLTGELILNSGTASLNKITQSIITGDISANPNLFKYTIMSHNSNSASGTSQRVLSLTDTFNSNALWFFPNISGGSFNSLCSANAKAIIGGNPIDNGSLVLSIWATQKCGVKVSSTGGSNSQTELWAGSTSLILNNATGITATSVASLGFTDSTTQTTAFTSAKNTKLNSIGNTMNANLMGNTTLTSGSFFNTGSIALSAGTWMICVNACLAVITGSTTVTQMLAGYSTSNTSLSQTNNLSIMNGGAITYGVGAQWVLTTTNIVIVPSTQLYYLLVQASFGTASNLQWNQGNSCLTAVRIA